MNRHSKFYADLKNASYEDDDYDDYEDGDDEEEYYEEGYDEGGGECASTVHRANPAPPVAVPAAANKLATVTPKDHAVPWSVKYASDPDFVLLEGMVPTTRELIKSEERKQGYQLCVTDDAIADALREFNYDEAAVVEHFVSSISGVTYGEGAKAGTAGNRLDQSSLLAVSATAVLPGVKTNAFPSQSRKGGGTLVISSTKASSTVKSGAASLKAEAPSPPPQAPTTSASHGKTSSVSRSSVPSEAAGASEPSPSSAAARSTWSRYNDPECVAEDGKADCTFVIAGHVDSGKSTTLGHLLLFLGKVTKQDVDRNEREGRQDNKQSFRYAWLLDQSVEERRRGVTIDSGSHDFSTEHKRIHVLDAPGHKDYVLNMISSATQADAALLVVTAAPSEFETGLQHGTKDHLIVLKTLGVGQIIVVVNKMDAVWYSEERFKFIVSEIGLLLKQTRFKASAVVGFCPISGIEGTNMMTGDREKMPWYTGLSLLQMIDTCPIQHRLLDAPLRLSLQDVQKSVLYCKVESGRLRKGDVVQFHPADVKVTVRSICKPTAGGVVTSALAGDTLEIDTSSSLVGLYAGCLGGLPSCPVTCSTDFEAHIQTFPTLERSVLPGSSFVMVCHALVVPVKVVLLVSKMSNSGEWSRGMVKCIPKNTQARVVFRAEQPIALELADVCRPLGRLLLRQDDELVAGGLVTRLMMATPSS